jgi:hypothetical protein
MDNLRLRQLAGLITEGKKWSGEVTDKIKADEKSGAKPEVPEGTFKGKAAKIAAALIKLHDGDHGKAMKALTFYCNRAGKDCENKEELAGAKDILKAKKKEKMESIASIRRLAGLLVEKKSDEDMDAEGGEEGEGDEEEELPKIVTKIAKQAEGKDVEALEKLIMKVYDAGHKDGMKAAEDGEGGEEKPVEEGKKMKGVKPVEKEGEEEIDVEVKKAAAETDPKAKAKGDDKPKK